jgi:hypothetical protein
VDAPTPSYASLLRAPGARGFVVAGFVGRLPRAMLALGIVLLVTAAGESYAVAGAVSATFGFAAAAGGPWLGRLTDRLGQARVLLPTLAVHALGVAGLVLCARLHAPRGAFFPAAIATGLALPSTGALVRVRWSTLLGDEDALATALALEGVVDEVCFTIGPFVVVTLATSLSASIAMLAALGLALSGGFALAAQRTTEPPIRVGGARSHEAMHVRGLLVVMVAFGALGLAFGAIDVAMVAFAQEHGAKAAAGPLLSLMAIASGVAGALYGTRQWRAPAQRRLRTTLVLLCAGCTAMALVDELWAMLPAIVLTGLTIAPALLVGLGLVRALVPAGRLTEGFAWLTTSMWSGLAAGNVVGGFVIDAASGHTAFLVAVAASAFATVVVAAGQRRLAAPPELVPTIAAA